MIWQIPEVWEILGTMEIAGGILMFSMPIFFLLFVCFGETAKAIRRQAGTVSDEDRRDLVLTWNFCKLGGMLNLFWLAIYELCLVMLILHPDIYKITIG